MKKIIFSGILCLLFLPAFAAHITGGEMFYTYITRLPSGNLQYKVTLKLYRDCNSTGAQLDDAAPIGVFLNNGTQVPLPTLNVTRTKIVTLQLTSPGPCVNNPPVVCYQVGYYEFIIDLPESPSGYTITYQRCCRIAGIENVANSSTFGATYLAQIPGTDQGINSPVNNSAAFFGTDTVVVCANNPFVYNFGAFDADGDSLSYSFCSAYSGGGNANSPVGGLNTPTPNPPAAPPYNSVGYNSSYNSSQPMGPGVSINSANGFVSGIAPTAGIYTVTVCVGEFRNGRLIATQRKDLQIKVADCSFAAATLNPQYVTCDGFSLSFSNNSNSPLINSYSWNFGVASQTNDTSNLSTPTFTFPDTGIYTITLITNRGQECSDTATSIAKVYPGFFPGFTLAGVCQGRPTQFFDTTKTRFGIVDSWRWDFGELSVINDTSRLQNPVYTFPSLGIKNVQFIATSSKGCIDTVFKDVEIIDKPVLSVAFKDTLICNGDNLQLSATGNGLFNWTPLTSIINAGTATPTVNPTTTTSYIVELNDNGCLNRDTVRVRVVNFVTLNARGDTTICQNDPVQLGATSNGLRYHWTPTASLNDPDKINPIATPSATTTYQVTASIGGCSARDDVTVALVPYPVANAGNDISICFHTSTQLNGTVDGSFFLWSPAFTLSNATILNPIANPVRTTSYVLTTTDNRGCPKPGRDTIIVTVLPEVLAFAGRDTAVITGQPLQLEATGGVSYVWSPPAYLSAVNIDDPTALFPPEIDNFRYRVLVTDQAGCMDSAFVNVKIFKTNPTIFVPTAFTPNGDGKNDMIRPIAVGIQSIEYFRIYNRWGQMVFNTSINGRGWDGSIGGKLQSNNTFVWMVKGIDYLGKSFFQKGTVTLIR